MTSCSVDTIILTQGALYRHDKNGVPKPELVDTLTTSPDGKTVTIKLKAGQKYSDGTPVTAADVKAAVDHQLNNATAGEPPTPGANKIFINSVKSADVVDDLTAILNLNYPDPDLLNGLSGRAHGPQPGRQDGERPGLPAAPGQRRSVHGQGVHAEQDLHHGREPELHRRADGGQEGRDLLRPRPDLEGPPARDR